LKYFTAIWYKWDCSWYFWLHCKYVAQRVSCPYLMMDVHVESKPGTDVMIFLYFRRKFQRKNWRFWLKTKLNYAKIFDHNIGFWEKRQFFRWKLSKIAENCDHNIDPRSDCLIHTRWYHCLKVGSLPPCWATRINMASRLLPSMYVKLNSTLLCNL
jgi:hypothetical protein